jgi:hypothetical protein
MAEELHRAGYELPGDEPSTALEIPGGGACEVYVCAPVFEWVA